MYSHKIVVALRAGGKILRDQDGCVRLPFGEEYSILLKNLESRKVVVAIDIDGDDVLSSNRLLIAPNESLELYGFMKGSSVTNKFKFIKRTENIENNRGIHVDDGIVRITFQFEKEKPIVQDYYLWDYNPCVIYPPQIKTRVDCSYAYGDGNLTNFDTITLTSNCSSNCDNSIGITTKGSETNQEFANGYIGALEERKHTIVLRLVGYKDDGNVVKFPIFTNDKIKCNTCGRVNSSANKFCPECGTYIEK
jgi:hypothetical protein